MTRRRVRRHAARRQVGSVHDARGRLRSLTAATASRGCGRGRSSFSSATRSGEEGVVEVTEGTDGRPVLARRRGRGPVRVGRPGAAPCRFAGPGLCGGCDFQHVALDRSARSRRRSSRSSYPARRPGRRRGGGAGPRRRDGSALADPAALRARSLTAAGRCASTARTTSWRSTSAWCERAPRRVYAVRRREFAVAEDGFWQVHPGAPEVLVDTVLDQLAPRPGESALDLYAGVGLFARFLLDAVGPAAGSSPSRPTRAATNAAPTCPEREVPRRSTSARVLATTSTSPSTWSSSTRRATVPGEACVDPVAAARRGRSPTSPATPRRSRATSRSSPSTATGWTALRAFDLFPMTTTWSASPCCRPRGSAPYSLPVRSSRPRAASSPRTSAPSNGDAGRSSSTRSSSPATPERPRFCYLGTANGDTLNGIVGFYRAFAGSDVRAVAPRALLACRTSRTSARTCSPRT